MKKLAITILAIAFFGIPSISHAAYATISLLQSTSTMPGAPATATTTFVNSTQKGGFIAVVIHHQTAGRTFTVTDSQYNLYNLATTSTNGTTGASTTMMIYYAENIQGGPDSVNVKVSGANAQLRMAILEYSGIASSGSLDGTIGSSSPITNVLAKTGKMTTDGSPELHLFAPGASSAPTTWTMLNGFTLREDARRMAVGDQIMSSTTPYGFATLSTAFNWNTVMASFHAQQLPPATFRLETEGLLITNGLLIIK